MGTKKRVLNLPTQRDKKAKKSVDYTEQSFGMVKGYKEIETLRDDPSRLENMTARELRTVMRGVGIPTKGNKQDLVSALRCFLLKQESGVGDQCSPGAGEDTPSVNPISTKNRLLKRKAENSAVGDSTQTLTSVSELPETKQRKNKGKSKLHQTSCFEGGSGDVVTGQKLSIGTEVLDMKRPRQSRKVSSEASVQQVSLHVNSDEPWTMLAHKKPQPGWVPYNPKTMRPPPLADGTKIVKLMSWNVNGLRALLKVEGFSALELAKREDFDVLCLQETKIQEKDVEDIKECLIHGYDSSFWTCSVSKLGYSGTAIISRIKPISVRYGLGIQDHDSEGRLVTVEFDAFYLLSGYVPNSGEGLKRLTYRITQWDPSLSNYMKDLEKSKPVILTGDLNCAHKEIDIYNPAGNRRSAGFTIEERESFEMNFLAKGFVDTFRKQHPGVVGYTYWGYRHGGRKTNTGWRLDYFLVSESIADKVHDSYIVPDVSGSDHCPIGLILKL